MGVKLVYIIQSSHQFSHFFYSSLMCISIWVFFFPLKTRNNFNVDLNQIFYPSFSWCSCWMVQLYKIHCFPLNEVAESWIILASRLRITLPSESNQLQRSFFKKTKQKQFPTTASSLPDFCFPTPRTMKRARVRVWVCAAVGGRSLPAGRCLVSSCQ